MWWVLASRAGLEGFAWVLATRASFRQVWGGFLLPTQVLERVLGGFLLLAHLLDRFLVESCFPRRF